MSGVSVFFSILNLVIKLLPEMLAMKARADERKEKFIADEKVLYEAAKALLAKAQGKAIGEANEARTIDEQLDKEFWEHHKK